MANQPESPSFDSGIYQLETVDPVQGGVGGMSNQPILGLANRTRYLKEHVDTLEAVVPTKAPLNSPALTGDPTAPTPPAGDSDTSVATTAFVQSTVNGITVKNVEGQGSIALTSAEAGSLFYRFTGVLTGNRTVVFPAKARQAVIFNDTSGAYSLTVKTAAGAGLLAQQGRTLHLVIDGTDARRGTTDFTDAALGGDPTAPTPPPGDSDKTVPNTEWVQSEIAARAAWSTGDLKITLKTVADSGWVMMNDGSIGNAASGATARANSDCLNLFVHLWNAIPDAWAPVPGGRGASALDDWNTNRRITLPRALGRALAVAGGGAGLTGRVLGSTVGAEQHQLTESEMPSHSHTAGTDVQGHHAHTAVTDVQGAHSHGVLSEGMGVREGYYYLGASEGAVHVGNNRVSNSTTVDGAHQHNLSTNATGAHGHNIAVNATGGSAAHSIMQPSLFINVMVKL